QVLKAAPHSDKTLAHMWAQLSFLTPISERPIGGYQIEVKAPDSVWEPAFTPDDEQELLPVALDICADPDVPGRNRCEALPPGTPLEATIAGLRANTQYQFRVTPRDRPCAEMGGSVETAYTTPERTFTTVTPCFVASAAYGSPLAAQIGVLRALRDRHLANHALGRAFIDFYYAVGPTLAEPVREHPWLAGAVRAVLSPLVRIVDWWMN
ncbi:MAG TPA: CFI-box-CTERM domain-containing protein, partial [Polyangiales bacterium]